MVIKSILFIFSFVITSSLAIAHPGHGVQDGNSLGHYLFSPLHLAGFVLVAAVFSVLIFNTWKQSRDNA